ncbi:DUF805 domain-containing protein [Pseudoalteromonas sp. NEC-BIFX-2020_002]|uniref:DUF805 domain-containing protein n=1 Tax=unclassified Pseudoalteromonas TaxID=194690 RepID=UPI0014615217|nr:MULTISPECIES: DUF805 domain-containing protein [unclassified Pseudoalteromonas]NMR25854.1 DUF805 domain-containing protein [Pseudoalteromonas sp. NEC-BIFX-2020_015]NNG43712.1 DUF805 domain-containing protein [Pseudoalteromonas sp. NEC-BIFX-2020_002]
MEYFMEAMRRYADFDGRIRRKAYWMFALFYLIFYIVCAVIDGVLGTMWITTIFSLAMIVPCISAGARRLHDTNRSGWWQLISFIPLIGAIVLIVFCVQDSQDGENDFGANPKEADLQSA